MARRPLRIKASSDTVKWGFFDARTPPVAEITSGEEVILDTLSGELTDIPDLLGFDVLPEHRSTLLTAERGAGPHIVTGPVAVSGARSGDVLAVEIREIGLRQNWGWNRIHPLYGTIPADFPETVMRYLPIDLGKNTVELPWRRSLSLRPFFGVMAVAPPAAWGRITTVIPRAHGGNMDNKELTPGTTVYFPVFNGGGLFSVGDGHGVQGDGEVCVTALETALTGRFRLSVRTDMTLSRPRAENDRFWLTMGFDEDLDAAVKHALRDMIIWLRELHGLSASEAYSLCSLAADFRVTQTVNVHKGIHCVLAKSVFKGDA
jgi:acetamidase/formamidase